MGLLLLFSKAEEPGHWVAEAAEAVVEAEAVQHSPCWPHWRDGEENLCHPLLAVQRLPGLEHELQVLGHGSLVDVQVGLVASVLLQAAAVQWPTVLLAVVDVRCVPRSLGSDVVAEEPRLPTPVMAHGVFQLSSEATALE